MKEKENNQTKIDQLLVQCALEAGWTKEERMDRLNSPNEDTLDCLSKNDLAALMDGRLAEDQRRQIYTHLDRCPECYDAWLQLSATRPSAIYQINLYTVMFFKSFFSLVKRPWRMEGKDVDPSEKRDGKGLTALLSKRSSDSWERHLHPWRVGLGMAMACLLIFFIYHSGMDHQKTQPTITTLIESSQDEILTGLDGDVDYGKPYLIDPPWEVTVTHYGFGQESVESELLEDKFRFAFSVGVWQAEQALINGERIDLDKTVSKEMLNLENYELGRWCFLLKSAGLSNGMLSSDFWSKQYEISEIYLKNYRKSFPVHSGQTQRPFDETDALAIKSSSDLSQTFYPYLTSKIEKINQLLKQSESGYVPFKTCRHIAGEASDIIQFVIK